MNFTRLSLSTLIPQIPKIVNDNFDATSNYINLFYDASLGVITKPIVTTGKIKGTTGEFVNVITDNFTVKKQFTNWYENTTTVDADFVTTYNNSDVSTRVSNSDPSTSIWPMEPSTYSWVDAITPNIKIDNDASYGFQNDNLGQEVRIIFANPAIGSDEFKILVDASDGGESNLTVTVGNAPDTWIKLITVAWDASYGPKWIVKEYAGTYSIT